MEKTFCIAGPIQPEKHYHLPFRFDERVLLDLIEAEKYFILHAPRQSGKTTAMRLFVDRLNASGNYKAFYINIEAAQTARSNVFTAMTAIIDSIENAINITFGMHDPSLASIAHKKTPTDMSGKDLEQFLRVFTKTSTIPTVVFIDEIDALVGDSLLSVLRQLRSGYAERPKNFPQSACLIGVRDVRDYRIYSEHDKQFILGGSAFNVKAESLTMEDFSPQEIETLYQQHTTATGQQFTSEAISYAFEQTQGQPWLVNALAYQACFRDVKNRAEPITLEVMERSREALVLRQDTHLDALIDKLSEERVRNIIDAIISGNMEPKSFPPDDIQYTKDLGMLNRSSRGLEIANQIYQDVFPRALVSSLIQTIHQKTIWYLNPDKTLNVPKLLQAFTEFYREHADILFAEQPYKEAAPHLFLLAFLQRIINGGGNIHREYAIGRGRVDLMISFGGKRFVIEIKIYRDTNTLSKGLLQTAEYMRTAGITDGHLVIFDRRVGKTWEEKIFHKVETVGDCTLQIWGM